MASDIARVRDVLYKSEHEVENIIAEYETGAVSPPSAGARLTGDCGAKSAYLVRRADARALQ